MRFARVVWSALSTSLIPTPVRDQDMVMAAAAEVDMEVAAEVDMEVGMEAATVAAMAAAMEVAAEAVMMMMMWPLWIAFWW